jgi:hypothetical protein
MVIPAQIIAHTIRYLRYHYYNWRDTRKVIVVVCCSCQIYCVCFFFSDENPTADYLVLYVCYQNPYIEDEQTTQWPKEKVQKDKQRSTKHTYNTKVRVTQTPLKSGGELILISSQSLIIIDIADLE